MGDDRSKVSEREFLSEIVQHPDPIVTATELSDRLPITPQAVNGRLNRLEQDGYVNSKEAGSAARVWWLTQTGGQRLDELRRNQSDGQ